MYARAKKEFKRDREDDDDPVVQPEVEPYTRDGCTAQSAVQGVVTGPLLTLEIEGGKTDARSGWIPGHGLDHTARYK
jgi:hypothetical protein